MKIKPISTAEFRANLKFYLTLAKMGKKVYVKRPGKVIMEIKLGAK